MYKGIVVQLPRSYYIDSRKEREDVLQMLVKGFDEKMSWSQISLPLEYKKSIAPAMIFNHGNYSFIYRELPVEEPSLFPIPIEAIVVPIINYSPDKSYERLLVQENLKRSIYDLLILLYRYYQLPVLLLEFIGDTRTSFGEMTELDWWDNHTFKTSLLQEIMPFVLMAHCTTDRLYEVPAIISQKLGLSLVDNGFSRLVIPSLPIAHISSQSLGIGKSSTLSFVQDCLIDLIPSINTFRVWIDAVHTIDSYSNDNIVSLSRKISQDILKYDDILFSKPDVKPIDRENWGKLGHIPLSGKAWEPGHCRAEPAYHLYLEYESLVHDGLIAFQEPVPIDEYQSNLNSTWRTSIEITSETTFDEAMQKLDNVLQRVKMGLF